jgi:membrane protein implicated in regulation of membrane protease activity
MMHQLSSMSQVELWLVLAFTCILIELLLAPGFGMLFIACGALTVSGLMYIIPALEDYQYQVFCLFAFFWVAILWKPLTHYLRSNKTEQHTTSDLIGQDVEVISEPLTTDGVGQVKWSGTIMNARLDHDLSAAALGTILKIRRVEGNVLICGYTKKTTSNEHP